MGKQNFRANRRRLRAKNDPASGATISSAAKSERFRFAVAFGLSCLGFHALLSVLPLSFVILVCKQTARTLGQTLNALGFTVVTSNNTVSGDHLAFQIVLECTALFMVGLFTCFVCFYPADARKKAVGLTVGVPALYLGNLVRLTAIFVVSWYKPGLFDFIHVYLGQVFTMFLLILACILWLKWVNRGPAAGPASKVAGFLGRFALISGCMFVFWMEVHHGYIWFLDRFVILGFSLFGLRLGFPTYAPVYYETFSIVTFTSLVLATRVLWARRVKTLAAGLCLFFILHLFHRVNNTLVSAFRLTPLVQLDIFLCDIGQYVLPILLWLTLAIRRSPRLRGEPHAPPRTAGPKRTQLLERFSK